MTLKLCTCHLFLKTCSKEVRCADVWETLLLLVFVFAADWRKHSTDTIRVPSHLNKGFVRCCTVVLSIQRLDNSLC